jgi:hypothetical protein
MPGRVNPFSRERYMKGQDVGIQDIFEKKAFELSLKGLPFKTPISIKLISFIAAKTASWTEKSTCATT